MVLTYNPLLIADEPFQVPVDSTSKPVLVIDAVEELAVELMVFDMKFAVFAPLAIVDSVFPSELILTVPDPPGLRFIPLIIDVEAWPISIVEYEVHPNSVRIYPSAQPTILDAEGNAIATSVAVSDPDPPGGSNVPNDAVEKYKCLSIVVIPVALNSPASKYPLDNVDPV